MTELINLYNDLEVNLSFDEIMGKMILTEDTIKWNYNLDMVDEDSKPYYDEDDFSIFKPSIEEELNNAYDNDIEIIENIIDDIYTHNNLVISEPEIDDNDISFEITLK